ncbi:MAG: hypothetical protein ACXADO_11510 [Candidatus Thorarchaeota archaeon]|jgi:hypothetical protein
MNVTITNLAIGGVDHIDIDGVDYPISDSGCTIAKVGEVTTTLLVGTPEPRVVERVSHYVVSVSMIENTLAMLDLAWNLPGGVSYDYGGTHDYLFLGIVQTVPTHAITIRGWAGLDAGQVTRQWREWYFRKAISYDYGNQDLGVGNPIYIPVNFHCYPDSSQSTGEEFGWVRRLT